MKRWPLLLTLMSLPGLALLGAWGAGRWEVARWDADLTLLDVPPVEGDGGFADLRYAWADRTPEARAGRLAGTVRRDTRAGYASDDDWADLGLADPWDEERERALEACFALEDEIASADCLAALEDAKAGEGGGAPGAAAAPPPVADGRPVGTVFGPKPDGRQPGAAADAPAAGVEKAARAAAAADLVDLRPSPDDTPGPAAACPLAAWGERLPDCLAALVPDAARAWRDRHAHALAAARRGLAAPHRRDPRPHGGRQPDWLALGRLARTDAALRFLDGDQAGGLAEACTLSLQWRRQLIDPGVTRGRLDGMQEADASARLALDMRLAAPALVPPAHCAEAFALPDADARPGVACLVVRSLIEDQVLARDLTPGQRAEPDRRRFAARLARPYCAADSALEREMLAGAPLEALPRDAGLGVLPLLGAPMLAGEAGQFVPDPEVLRALLDLHAQRRALHAAWALADARAAAAAGAEAPDADIAAWLAARDPGAGGAQALGLGKSGQWIEVPVWGAQAFEADAPLPGAVYRVPLAPPVTPAPPPAPPAG